MQQLKQSKTKKSFVWQHVKEQSEKDGSLSITCQYCSWSCKPRTTSTSNVAYHLKTEHLSKLQEMKPAELDIRFAFQKQILEHSKQQAIDIHIARFVAIDNLPLATVEKAGFHGLMNHLTPLYVLPSRNHLKELIAQQFEERLVWVCYFYSYYFYY
jgi:Na+-translocating ferredoxin:NAD+ oxidoreductase RnfC subunit